MAGDQDWTTVVDQWQRLDREQRYKTLVGLESAIVAKLQHEEAKNTTALRAETALQEMKDRTQARVPWLLVDIPAGRSGSQAPLHYVLETHRRRLRKDNRAVGEVEESKFWKEYAGGLGNVAGRIRFVCDPRFMDTLEASLDWQQGLSELVGAMTQWR